MTTLKPAAVDTNILVALVDSHDQWHARARALRDALKAAAAELVYFDPVLNEAISVLARRAQEQGRSHQFISLVDALMRQVPAEVIVWLSSETQRLYGPVIELVRDTSGDLNFHDALIAIGCKELGVPIIISFDRDFDRVPWLTRVDTPEAVMTTFKRTGED